MDPKVRVRVKIRVRGGVGWGLSIRLGLRLENKEYRVRVLGMRKEDCKSVLMMEKKLHNPIFCKTSLTYLEADFHAPCLRHVPLKPGR